MSLENAINCFKTNSTMTMSSPPEARADCGPVLWTSGIVQSMSDLNDHARSKSKSFEAEYRLPISLSDPFTPVECFDPATGAGPNGDVPDPCDCDTICTNHYRGLQSLRANCWQYSDVAKVCEQSQVPVEEYLSDFILNEFWIRFHEREMLAIMEALALDNVANDNSDMVIDVTGEANPADQLYSCDVHIRAMAQMGCKSSDLAGTVMHEDVFFSNLLANEKECCQDNIYPSEQIARSPMLANSGISQYRYQGKPVYLMCDDILKDTSGPTPVYKSYCFGNGLFGYGAAPLSEDGVMGFEEDRDPCVNGGFGATKWYSRQKYILHPIGWTNKYDPACTGTSDFLAIPPGQLRNPANWDRSFQRKNIPFVAICTSG